MAPTSITSRTPPTLPETHVPLIYQYYPDGSRSQLTTEADVIYYRYDKAGRCVELESQLGIAEFEYYGNGWMASRTVPSGSQTEFEYNDAGLITNLQHKNSLDSTSHSYSTLQYDGVFNLIGMDVDVANVSAMSGSITYGYDSKNRLTSESSTRFGNYSESHAYDGAGNPTTFRNVSSVVYNDSNQRTGTGFAYDGNGNPTTWRGTTATFDRENRMTSYGTMTAGYRPDGLRAWRQYGSGGKTFFMYDNGNVVCEIAANGGVTASNVFAPDGLVGRQEFGGETTTNMEYLFDVQGNVVAVLKSDETASLHIAYNAWGARNYFYPEEESEALIQPFSYNGRWGYYYDQTVDLYYCQNRYYDPEAGRWLTRDPISFAGGVNLYSYCANLPVGTDDRTGLQAFPSITDMQGERSECDELLEKVREIAAEVRRQYDAMLRDHLNLYPWRFFPGGNPTPGSQRPNGKPHSWAGHQFQFLHDQWRLYKAIMEYMDKCMDRAPEGACDEAMEWVTIPYPAEPAPITWAQRPVIMPSENYGTGFPLPGGFRIPVRVPGRMPGSRPLPAPN